MAVIQLRPAAPVKPKKAAHKRTTAKRRPTREQILAALGRQADYVYRTGDWAGADDLDMLRFMLRAASPRSKSVWWRGIRFPIRRGLYDSIRCPDTGRGLVGVL